MMKKRYKNKNIEIRFSKNYILEKERKEEVRYSNRIRDLIEWMLEGEIPYCGTGISKH